MVGDQATGDLTAQMPRKVSAVHVINLPVWMVASDHVQSDPQPHRYQHQRKQRPFNPLSLRSPAPNEH